MTAHPKAQLSRSAAALAGIAVTTAVNAALGVNPATAGFLYLLVVLGLAAAWGMPAAAVAAFAATACFNYYFLPPVGAFTIADPQNWVALAAFLATALVAGQLSERVKRQAVEATNRRLETERLYTLSRTILTADHSRAVGSQVVRHIAEIFGCTTVVLYVARTGEIFCAGPEELPDIAARLKAGVRGTYFDGTTTRAAILLSGNVVGSIATRGMLLSDGALKALLNLVAIALERERTEESASRAEAARQSEAFKSTLIDAIAHEFRTPLTAIKAASTSMLCGQDLAPETRELTTIIDEECDRLSTLVTDAIRLAQLDAGKLRLDRRALDIEKLVRRVLTHFAPRSEGRSLRVAVARGVPAAWADPDLLALALRQIVDNALKYSFPDSPIDFGAGLEQDRVVIRIRDHGPGIPEQEQERIFEKFYRRVDSNSQISGTGLGLHIAREIVRTQGGDVWMEGEPGAGSEFAVAVPVYREDRGG